MGVVKEILIGILFVSVILVAITTWQSDLFTTYGVNNVTTSNGKPVAYLNKTSEVEDITSSITNRLALAGNSTQITDQLGVFLISLDIGKLVLKTPQIAYGLFMDSAFALEDSGITGASTFAQMLLIVISVSVVLALAAAVFHWEL